MTPTPGRSSVAPLQSLSTPSHVSGLGPTPPTQVSAPLEHAITPAVHGPIPHLPEGQQATAEPGTSSMIPLQSSSMPLQASTPGSTSPTQAPKLAALGQI